MSERAKGSVGGKRSTAVSVIAHCLLLLKAAKKFVGDRAKRFIGDSRSEAIFVGVQKAKRFISDRRSTVISVGIHCLLFLLLFDLVAFDREDRVTTFVTRVIPRRDPAEKEKEEIPLMKEQHRPKAGFEGLEGLKGGGVSSPKLKEEFMVRKEMNKDFVERVTKPMSNIRTRLQDLFTPSRQVVAVRDTRARSFNVPQSKGFDTSRPSGPSSDAALRRPGGDTTRRGLAVPGDAQDSGRPDGIVGGTGIGSQAGGDTGAGGGSGVGFSGLGSGFGSGTGGTGPGGGQGGHGGGTGVGGTGPGFGHGSGGSGGSGRIEFGNVVVAPPISPPPSRDPVRGVPDARVPEVGPDNPVTGLSISVETAGTAGFTLRFSLDHPADRLLINDAKFTTDRVVEVGPFAVSPEDFVFRMDITTDDYGWGASRGIPRNYTLYSNDSSQVRTVDQGAFGGSHTIIYRFEDLPISAIRSNPGAFPNEPDFDDAVITITFRGERR